MASVLEYTYDLTVIVTIENSK